MITRLYAVGLFATVVLAVAVRVPAQASDSALPAVVNEAKARATLAERSIRFELPLNAPAIPEERVVAWLLSPADTRSEETAAELAKGSRLASLVLPWPEDGRNDPAEPIGWYRIGYRVEVSGAPVAHGVVAVGAIASNLLDLRLARPEKLVSGKPLSVRVWAGNPITRAPFSGVQVQATLAIDATEAGKSSKRTMVREARTGSSGEALLSFPIKTAAGQTATLTVAGTMTGSRGIESGARGIVAAHAQATIKAELETGDRSAIHIETDKPLHKPGETVHLRALVFDDSRRAAANTALTLTIDDPDNKTLLEVPLTTNRFGIAFYDWKTTAQLATGDYEASFEVGDSSDHNSPASSTIRIQRYELPEFSVSAAMDRSYYMEGQTPVARIHAGYLFGKPVTGGSVRIVRADEQKWNSKTGKYDEPKETEQSATLDANGDTELRLDVKEDFDDFKDRAYERYNDIRYRALVTDSTTGRSEPRNFTVRLTRYPVHIYVRELGTNEHEGDYLVSTSYADGAPVGCKVTLDWVPPDSVEPQSRSTRAATVTTSRYGLAQVHLRFPAWELKKNQYGYTSGYGLRVTARDPEGRISRFDDTEEPGSGDSVWISIAHTLLKPGQPIEATMHGPVGATIDVEVLSEEGSLAHQQVRMHSAEEPFTVPAGPRFHGLVALQTYTMNEETPRYRYGGYESIGFKSVLYPEDRELKIKLAGVRPSYLPGAEVDAGLAMHNPSGSAAPGALGVAAIDTAVEQRAETEEEANDIWFGSHWWQDGANVGGVTRASLDKTDMSRPVPDDLNLAAEAGLQDTTLPGMQVETSDYEDARSVYESGMERDVKPLGEAILAARPQRLPASINAVRSIARAAKLDDALLLDPWATPYKVEAGVEWNNQVVRLVSAGPDKRFGTGDDFKIDLVGRNYFALPGERLTKLVEDAVKDNKPLPATAGDLDALARAGGLNLDATYDPQGKPYRYEVQVWRRSLSIHVFPHDATTGTDGHYSASEFWTSPAIDYFSQTEQRLEAAIRNWTAAGKPFPSTEAEARQAFTAAGIDFDALRDPLGKPLQLRSTQLMAYTRIEKVKAVSGGLEAKSKPVTHLMRAIQVLRSVEPAGDKPSFELVAQFLHPITEQSGGDLKPQAVEQGAFKGNNGAIGGTVTDRTGAVIAGAVVEVETGGGEPVASGKTLENGIYVIADLAPGVYSVKISARGFMGFSMRDVYVGSAALTTVDVELNVGAATETVTVEANVMPLQTQSASVSSTARAIASPGGKASISEPRFTPRLRHVFEETAFWTPSLETDAQGHASLHFRLPDSLTTWKLHALASTVDGRFAALDRTFKTFQTFFVDLDAPQVLTVGDEIALPVNLRNYTAHSVALPVTAKPADWMSLFTPSTVEAHVASNGTTPVVFGFRASKAVEAGPLRITAANGREGDAVEKTIRVHPDGEPRAVTASALLRPGATTLALDLPADAVPGSVHAELLLYPNLGTHLLHAIKAVLERPYGCGEQTISSTYPSLLFLEMLTASKGSSPMEGEAQNYLQQGYDRLLGYFRAGGGLTYWGRGEEAPDPALTAYGIEFLIEAEPYIAVDRSRIADAVGWLGSNQQADGSWKPHYGDTNADLNLYVADVLKRALAREEFAKSASPNTDFKALKDRVDIAVSKAVAWAASSAAAVHDPYANALRLRLAGDAATAARLRAELTQTAIKDRQGAHWASEGHSPFYGWGHAGELETTALVLEALGQGEASNKDKALTSEALYYLLRSQDRYGIWYSGQATVRVLEALLPLAIDEMKTPAGSQQLRLTIDGVPLADKDAEALRADPKLLDAPRSLDLTALLKPGHNELAFLNASDTALASAEASASYYVPWTKTAAPAQAKTQTGTDYGLDFGYNCAADHANVGQPIDCAVDLRRFGSNSYGMLLAEVGLPPGADVDRASLAKLLDDWTISRYELQPDRMVFYLWSWRAEGTHFSFRFTPRYAIRAKAAPATLSDYYNPDLKVVLTPQSFTVTDSRRN
jgi:hypothetical protein